MSDKPKIDLAGRRFGFRMVLPDEDGGMSEQIVWLSIEDILHAAETWRRVTAYDVLLPEVPLDHSGDASRFTETEWRAREQALQRLNGDHSLLENVTDD